MSQTFDPGRVYPFYTYRRFDATGGFVEWDLAPTLVHHYESERFRGVSEELRMDALEQPTAKESRKFARRYIKQWRSDWKQVRASVMRSGIAMLALHNRAGLRMLVDARKSLDTIRSAPPIYGIPGAFWAQQLDYFFSTRKMLERVDRLCLITLNGCVPPDLADRLTALYPVDRPFSATVYAGHDADPAAEMWCASNAIPIKHIGMDWRRIRESETEALLGHACTVVACVPENRVVTQTLRQLSKTRGKAQFRLLEFGISA